MRTSSSNFNSIRASRNWLPMACLLGAIAAESTRTAGQSHTQQLLFAVLHRLHLTAYFPNLSLTNMELRKLGHFCGYGLLGLFSGQVWMSLLLHSGKRRWQRAARRAAGYGVLTSTTVATLDEWHQRYLPGRNSSFDDVLLDTAGAILFVSLFLLVRSMTRRRAGLDAELIRG